MSLSRNEADLASVSCLEDQVRDRLYAFVASRSEPVRRDEAAAAVGIGRALAVYHLDKLVESGLLSASYQRPPGRGGPGAGRPAKVYFRSSGEFMVTIPPREYQMAAGLLLQAVAADRSGALLTQNPSALISALTKVSQGMNRIPTQDLRAAEPLNAFYFAPAMKLNAGASLSAVFSTHPTLEKRIEQLSKIQRELGQVDSGPRGLR